MVTELTEVTDGELMYAEAGTGREITDPDDVVMVWVMYGLVDPGVLTVVMAPFGVVTETVSGLGIWRVAVPPVLVSMATVSSQSGTLTVAVPPECVITCETSW